MIAVAGVSVNHDGRDGTAPDPLVWDQGGRRKVRRTDSSFNVDLASLPGPPGFLGGPWIQVHGSSISGADIAAWPYSVGILIRFTSFLSGAKKQTNINFLAARDFFCPCIKFIGFLLAAVSMHTHCSGCS